MYVLGKQEVTEVVMQPWQEVTEEAVNGTIQPRYIRKADFRFPMPYRMPHFPSSTRVTSTYRLFTQGEGDSMSAFVIVWSTTSHDVPFGECFRVVNRLAVSKSQQQRVSNSVNI